MREISSRRSPATSETLSWMWAMRSKLSVDERRTMPMTS